MRTTTLVFILFVFSTLISANNPSRIQSVTVYPDRAVVTRVLTVSVNETNSEITFDSLLPGVVDDSIRVSANGSTEVKITGMELRTQVLPEPSNQGIRDLENEIQSLDDQTAAFLSHQRNLQSQRAFLESMKIGFTQQASKDLATREDGAKDLLAMFQFLGSALQKITEEEQAIEIRKRETGKKKTLLAQELGKLKSKSVHQEKSVTVGFQVTESGQIEFQLTYLIPGAGWRPVYDARLAEKGNSVDLHYKAIVHQTTGEDWKDVKLTLSTARPSIGADPPKLAAWKIQLVEPTASLTENMVVVADSPVQQWTFDKNREYYDSDAFEELASVETRQANVLFHIPGKTDIPSDGNPHTTTISILKFGTTLEYLAVPKASQYAFLRSEIKNTSGLPLLSGKANIFHGNDFSGVSTIPYVADSQNFRLYFGVDQGIRVKRRHSSLSDETEKDFAFTIEVENFKPEAQRVVVLDQLPVSEHADLKVKRKDFSLQPTENNPDGTVKWIVQLAPQQKQTIQFAFEVDYPRNMAVNGLR